MNLSSWGAPRTLSAHSRLGGQGLPGTRTVLPQTRAPGTWPGAHSVPSRGGPFLVLQKYGLSGWLHHSCLQGSKVWNCTGRGERSPAALARGLQVVQGAKGSDGERGGLWWTLGTEHGEGGRRVHALKLDPTPVTSRDASSLQRGTEKGQDTATLPLLPPQASLPALVEATVPLDRD